MGHSISCWNESADGSAFQPKCRPLLVLIHVEESQYSRIFYWLRILDARPSACNSSDLMPTLTDTILVIRCPYCLVGIECKPMIAYKDGRFVCRDCAHTVRPGVEDYRCTCRTCMGWRGETTPGGLGSPVGTS